MQRVRTWSSSSDGLRGHNRVLPNEGGDGSEISINFTSMTALDGRFTFTRPAGTGTGNATFIGSDGYIQTASGADVPRFSHDPFTKKPLGLLLERGSTNFSTGGFSAHSNVSLASAGGETLSPTGGFNATKVTKTSNSVGYVKFRARNDKAPNSTSGGYGHIISMFVKRGDVDTTISLESETNTHWQDVAGTGTCWSCTFNLTSSDCTIGTISYPDESKVSGPSGYSTSASNAAQVTKYQDGWYRISFKFKVYTVPASNDPPTVLMRMTGNTDTSMFVFGPQVETAPSATDATYTNGPTSYIPFNTTLGGTPSARGLDYCVLTADNFRYFNQSAGSFWIEMSPLNRCDKNVYSSFSAAGGCNIYSGILYGWLLNQAVPYVQSPNAANSISADPSTPGQHRLAFAYEGSTYVGAIDGLVPKTMQTVTTAILPSGTSVTSSNRCVVGGLGDATQMNTCIARFKYWPRRLDNSTLQYLTSAAYEPDIVQYSSPGTKPVMQQYLKALGAASNQAQINLQFTSPEAEGLMPEIMSFVRGSGGTYRCNDDYLVGFDFSSTSNSIGTGTKTFTLSADAGVDRKYLDGDKVVIRSGANTMSGVCINYNRETQVLTASITSTSGSGTFTSWSIGRNAPRWDWNDGATEINGVLIEEERTNLLNWSQSFATSGGTNNNWTTTNISRVAANPSPDGSDNADRFVSTAANATIISTAAVTSGSATDRVFSVWLRRHSGSGNIQLTMNNGTTWSTVTISSTWARYNVSSNSTSATVGIRIVTSGDQIEAWGAQLEVGLEATSYIPTAANQITRLADQLSVNFSYGGPNPYNPLAGTMLVDIGPRPTGVGIGYSFVYPDAINGDSWVIEGDGYSTQVAVEGTETFSFNLNTYMPDRQRSVFSYNTITETYHSRISDGTTVYDLETLNSPGEFPDGSELTQIWIGSFDGSTGYINTHVKEFVYYPFDLSPDAIGSLLGVIIDQPPA